MSSIKFALRFLIHCLKARNTKGYGVHSPYVFHFVRYVLNENMPFYVFKDIEKIREQLLLNNETINVTDFGAGANRKDKIRNLAKRAMKSPQQAQLLFRIVHCFKLKNIMELGTSFGITTMYLASVDSKSQCVTLEGCPEISNIAKKNFQTLGLSNIKLYNCNIDKELGAVLAKHGQQDLIFIDANHRYQPLMNYFETSLKYIGENSIMIIDDINWSDDMRQAWNVIQKHPEVTSTIDLFYMGIVFFNPVLTRKNYVVRIT
ncbi:class I SAM-dependent methyltransferase [Paludibacter sp.]